MLLFFTTFALLEIPLGILQAMFSRRRERMADEFASEKLNLGTPLALALEKLTFQNFSPFYPHPWLEFLTYSHPAPWRRIRSLREN
jgi:Zn-dependent protease with chaperone function